MLLVSTSAFSQIYNLQVEAKIDLKTKSDFIEITGTAFNKMETSQSFRYVLSVIKNDPKTSNRSKNDQSGRVVLDPGQKENLSKTSINVNDKDRIIILLLLFNTDDDLIGKDRIVINGNEEDKKAEENNIKSESYISPDAKHEKADGLVLKGIVLDETKTKPGRDFYKMFYSLYSGNNINGYKIVTVKEVLILASTTAIRVSVGDEAVYEFVVKPQNDYLKDNSREAIRKVYFYFESLRQNENIKKRY